MEPSHRVTPNPPLQYDLRAWLTISPYLVPDPPLPMVLKSKTSSSFLFPGTGTKAGAPLLPIVYFSPPFSTSRVPLPPFSSLFAVAPVDYLRSPLFSILQLAVISTFLFTLYGSNSWYSPNSFLTFSFRLCPQRHISVFPPPLCAAMEMVIIFLRRALT